MEGLEGGAIIEAGGVTEVILKGVYMIIAELVSR